MSRNERKGVMRSEDRHWQAGSLRGFDAVALFVFAATSPLTLPALGAWDKVIARGADGESRVLDSSAPFLHAFCLAGMAVALGYLFVCLLKTAYARIGRPVLLAGATCYAAGTAVLASWSFGILSGFAWETTAGLLTGVGSAVLALIWFSLLGIADFRRALATTVGICLAIGAASIALAFAGPDVTRALLATSAVVTIAGCLHASARRGGASRHNDSEQSNWWDVFGHMDASLVDGGQIESPVARALFFIVAPLAVLLLFDAVCGLMPTVRQAADLPAAACAMAGLAALTPLARFKSDRGLFTFAYRFFLPVVAFVTFAVGVLVDPAQTRAAVMSGAVAYCVVYAALMGTMLVVAAGRMPSLALPGASLALVTLCLVEMIVNAPLHIDSATVALYPTAVALMAGTVALFAVVPGQRLWRGLLAGIDSVQAGQPTADTYAERCEAIAVAYKLTPRETDVLSLLGRGRSAVRAAQELVVAESTIRTHRKNIYQKLGISSREELMDLIEGVDLGK